MDDLLDIAEIAAILHLPRAVVAARAAEQRDGFPGFEERDGRPWWRQRDVEEWARTHSDLVGTSEKRLACSFCGRPQVAIEQTGQLVAGATQYDDVLVEVGTVTICDRCADTVASIFLRYGLLTRATEAVRASLATPDVDPADVAAAWDGASNGLRILFVCSGNNCRSPMAAALARRALAERGVEAVVRSAGTKVTAMGASEEAIAALRADGLDLTSHRATEITVPLVLGADLVLAMSQRQVGAVRGLAGVADIPLYPLRELVSRAEAAPALPGEKIGSWLERLGQVKATGDWDVNDPFGKGAECYAEVALDLSDLTQQLAAALEHVRPPQRSGSDDVG